jgi:putative transposase
VHLTEYTISNWSPDKWQKPQRRFYRRTLPHWQPEGSTIFLTWRLYGSLPESAVARIKATRELLLREAKRTGESVTDRKARHNKKLFGMLDAMLDKAESGPLWLKEKSIADLVEDALLDRYAGLYKLWSYVVMANHVHVLLRPDVLLEKVTQFLKGYTAREANRFLNRTGSSFWQDESFDHWVRDDGEFHRIVHYIENNPVKAGLVKTPEDFLWSSARQRLERGWHDTQPLT